jgi:hypothetical protein
MINRATARSRHIQLRWILAAFAAYLSGSLIFRWLREPLFLGGGPDGWPAPSFGELTYLLYMTCLPVAVWLLLAYAGARRITDEWRMRAILMLVFLLVLCAVELDNIWYDMSLHHATWREVRLFLSENWRLHYGIRASDERGFLWRMSKHFLRLVLVFFGAGLVSRWERGPRCFSASFRRVLTVVLVLVVGDVVLTGYQMSRGSDQWQAVADANPFRIHALDRLSERLFSYGSEHNTDLEAASRAFSRASGDAMQKRTDTSGIFKNATTLPHERYHVVIVTIEGLNARLVDSTTMPFWTQLAARSTSLRNHYSTGNVTEYGVLGLLYGAPPDFYRGTAALPWRHELPSAQQPPQPGSPYISEFVRRGYHTRLISWELSSWAQLGIYLRNFNEPAFETTDDWKLIPELARELQDPGPHLAYMHYNGTHFPYAHAQSSSQVRPEVPSAFDYSSGQMRSQAPEITNRYRNCLLELDAWLRSLVGVLDLQHTIVVLTGDHGEEFFEHSRLGHASTLDAPQIRTVALIYVPGQPPRVVDVVTSHADLMPTLMDYLGWPQPVPPFGHSLAGDVKGGAAIVAMANRPNPPIRWAAIAGDAKGVFVEESDTLRLVHLLDTADHRLSYSADPARWQPAFAAAAQLQLRFRMASSPIRAVSTAGAEP